MHNRKKIALWIFSIISLAIGILLTSIWHQRYMLEYNSESRYYSVSDSIVYNQDSVLVFGLLATIFLTFGFVSLILILKIKK